MREMLSECGKSDGDR